MCRVPLLAGERPGPAEGLPRRAAAGLWASPGSNQKAKTRLGLGLCRSGREQEGGEAVLVGAARLPRVRGAAGPSAGRWQGRRGRSLIARDLTLRAGLLAPLMSTVCCLRAGSSPPSPWAPPGVLLGVLSPPGHAAPGGSRGCVSSRERRGWRGGWTQPRRGAARAGGRTGASPAQKTRVQARPPAAVLRDEAPRGALRARSPRKRTAPLPAWRGAVTAGTEGQESVGRGHGAELHGSPSSVPALQDGKGRRDVPSIGHADFWRGSTHGQGSKVGRGH